MDRRAQKLAVFRAAHERAIENYDYAAARDIQVEIRRIQSYSSAEVERQANLTLQRGRVQTVMDREAETSQMELQEMLRKLRKRFDELETQHHEQRSSLRAEFDNLQAREKRRPMPEVDQLLMRSKVYGRDHQYRIAEQYVVEARKREAEIFEERRLACHATYKDQLAQMRAKQGKELEVLDAAIDAAYNNVTNVHKIRRTVLARRARVKECNNGVWPPEEYTFGPFSRDVNVNTTRSKKKKSRKVKGCNRRLDPTLSWCE